jgi:hypothetical protein
MFYPYTMVAMHSPRKTSRQVPSIQRAASSLEYCFQFSVKGKIKVKGPLAEAENRKTENCLH